MAFVRWTGWVAVLLLLPAFAGAQSALDAAFRTVDSLYAAGAYAQAELEARRMLEQSFLRDSLRAEAEQRVAFALVAQGRTALAKEHFLSVLRFTPTRTLDPLLVSPKILAVFNDARAAYRIPGHLNPDSLAAPGPGEPGQVTFRTIVFPGWEQWHQGRTAAGWAFAGAGVVSLGAGLTFELLRSAARRDYLAATTPDDIEARYRSYNRYRKAEGYSFAAFAAVYLASELEVFTSTSSLTVSTSTAEAAAGDRLVVRLSLP